MSENAVIELSTEELELLDDLIGLGFDASQSADWDDIIKLTDNIKEQAKKSRSIIDWHSMDENPDKFNWVITKDINGFISSDYVVYIGNDDWHLERTEKSCLTAWAYLPN